MGYDAVTTLIQENNLSWGDIDRIELYEETYDEFRERASFSLSNYATNNKPAVRVTTKEEKIVYVDDNGIEVTISI